MGQYFQGVRNAIIGAEDKSPYTKQLLRAMAKEGPLIEYPDEGLLDEEGSYLLDERTSYLCERSD